VASHEAGVNRPAKTAESKQKHAQKSKIQWDAGAGRHDQSIPVERPAVVHAVNQEMQTLAPRSLTLPVEDQAMQPILGECPRREADRE